uniref:Homeobox transcription factor HD14 n=1 Tax=Mnemiopsis leidyi TaxID=27923 RepID=E3UJU3_MNELE|nr:homeobox transcription factor HD14 [Mnemiopsis leidyi]
MSALLPNTEIKQELLFTLDKLIRHSQNEAQLLKDALDSLKQNSSKSPGSQDTVRVKEEIVDVLTTEHFSAPSVHVSLSEDAPCTPIISSTCPPILSSPDTVQAAQTLLRIKNELSRELQRVSPREEIDEVKPPLAKRPRIDLSSDFFLQSAPAPPVAVPTATPMVLVPIPADKVRELLVNGGTIPPMSLLSALPFSQVGELPPIPPTSPQLSTSSLLNTELNTAQSAQPTSPGSSNLLQSPSTSPSASSTSPPLLSPTMSSSILRFCERRSDRRALDVFHYLPADARSSPFPTTKPTNYRQFLDDLTVTKVKIPKLPKNYEALPKLTSGMNERTVYTPFQTERLEQSFSTNPFLTKDQREKLSKELNIHAGRIKVWYQNRRARKRREEVLKEKIETAARTGSTTASTE